MYQKLFLALALLPGAASAADPVAFRATAKVEIDAAGKSMKVEASKDVPNPLAVAQVSGSDEAKRTRRAPAVAGVPGRVL